MFSLSSSVELVAAIIILLATVIVFFIIATKRSFDYKNKHVLITGGSSGIGLALAKEYRLLGANVSLVARDVQKLNDAKRYLDSIHVKGEASVAICSVDTSGAYDTINAKLQDVLKAMGDVDVLVCCAGTSIAGELDKLDPKEFERMMRINLLGSIHPVIALLPGMKKKAIKSGGRIVFIASQVEFQLENILIH